jgi:hypothetical protein
MATFGLTTAGGSFNNFSTGFAMAQQQTMGSIAGTADSLEIYSDTTTNAAAFIYNQSGTDNTTLVAASASTATSSAAGWTVCTLAGESLSASTNYGIGFVNQSTGAICNIYWDLTAGNRGVGSMADTPPSPWTTDGNNTSRVYSYFVNYTEDSAAGNPSRLLLTGMGS